MIILLLACATPDPEDSKPEDTDEPTSPECVELDRTEVTDLEAEVEGAIITPRQAIDEVTGSFTGQVDHDGNADTATEDDWTSDLTFSLTPGTVTAVRYGLADGSTCSTTYEIAVTVGFATANGAFAETAPGLVTIDRLDRAELVVEIPRDEVSGNVHGDNDPSQEEPPALVIAGSYEIRWQGTAIWWWPTVQHVIGTWSVVR